MASRRRRRGHKGKRHSSSSRRSRRMYRVPGKPGAFSQHGGSHLTPATYAAGGSEGAAPYVLSQYGDGNTQWDNVFRGSGQSPYGTQLVNLQHPGVTSPASLSPPPTQKGGSRKTGKGRGKKGGFIGSVLSQAVVPFGLLALQQSYGRRMKSRRTGRK